MSREPLWVYLFRLGLQLAFVVILALLWWSSLLVENDLNDVRQELSQLKQTLTRVSLQQAAPSSDPQQQKDLSLGLSDPSLPNILQEDPFLKVLPKLLGSSFSPYGTRVQATYAKPKDLNPFSGYVDNNTWTDMCRGAVASQKFGIYETTTPNFAWKMERRKNAKTGAPEFWVHLRRGLFWEPIEPSFFQQNIHLAPFFQEKHPVTAHDFKFYYDVLMNPFVEESGAVSARTTFQKLEAIEVLDDLTFVVRWRTEQFTDEKGQPVLKAPYTSKLWTGGLRPLAGFVYKYFANGTKIIEDDKDPETYRKNSIWAQNFSQHWAKNIIPSCGPWSFVGMTDRQLSFKRNDSYYDPLAALTERQEYLIKQSPETIWQSFKAGEIDNYDLQPTQLAEWETFLTSDEYVSQKKKGNGVSRLDYLKEAFNYIGWNAATPYFSSNKTRKAMTLAIDRERIIRTILNGMGEPISGPFFPRSPSYDTSILPLPYDPEGAKTLLEEEGWYDREGSGVRSKIIDGKKTPFNFTLTYYVKNPISSAICAYVSTNLKEIGVQCQLNGVDVTDLTSAFEDKSFDAIYFGWGQGSPPEDPRQLWHSSGAKQKGSSNAVGFANTEADKIIDALEYEDNPKKRDELYHRFHRIMHNEQPYTFLYNIKTALVYRDYLQNVFIPAQKQDLIPGANMEEPQGSIFWIRHH